MAEPFTKGNVIDVWVIVNCAITNAKVARLMDTGDVVLGTARAITDAYMNFLPGDVDIREGYLWVTTTGGMEANWPIVELLPQVRSGEFAQYDF